MSKFGKYAVIDTITHTFEKEPDWYWKIKSPTSGDELKMSRFMVNARIERGPDGIVREYPPSNPEIAHHEIALLFDGTNISNDEDGKDPIIKVGEPVEEIEAKLRLMPHAMIMELWEAIGEAIPGWGVMRPKTPETKESSKKSTKS